MTWCYQHVSNTSGLRNPCTWLMFGRKHDMKLPQNKLKACEGDDRCRSGSHQVGCAPPIKSCDSFCDRYFLNTVHNPRIPELHTLCVALFLKPWPNNLLTYSHVNIKSRMKLQGKYTQLWCWKKEIKVQHDEETKSWVHFHRILN